MATVGAFGAEGAAGNLIDAALGTEGNVGAAGTCATPTRTMPNRAATPAIRNVLTSTRFSALPHGPVAEPRDIFLAFHHMVSRHHAVTQVNGDASRTSTSSAIGYANQLGR
jgi:hypothetical protein